MLIAHEHNFLLWRALNDMSRLYWITGLSGSGKTTIGTLLYDYMKVKKSVVLLDGDTLREVFGGDLGYTAEDRLKSAMRNARLCRLLTSQGIDVVCCTISMFNGVRDWNRQNIEGYTEIYIEVPQSILLERNQKQLYTLGKDVVGMDVLAQLPTTPDIKLVNDGRMSPDEMLNNLIKELEI